MQRMADMPALPPASPMQELPDINQDMSWKPGEGEQVPYETDWDYLNELFGTFHHDMFTTPEMQGL